jgi:thioredoxin-related protein
MNNISKKLEVAANVAILVVALLLGVVLVKRYLAPGPPPEPPRAERLKPGDKLALEDVDWRQSKKTLVMVLSTNCHYCTESAPFYQRLAREKSGRDDVRLLAVLPQSVEESRKYLDTNGVAVNDVRQEKSGAIRVPGTPTLIMVDSSGAVVDSWVGKLPPEKEDEVLKSLLSERAGD